MRRPLLVIDGDSFAHRAYHALPKNIRRRGNKGAGAILGFANFLLRLYESEKPRAVLVALDTLDSATCAVAPVIDPTTARSTHQRRAASARRTGLESSANTIISRRQPHAIKGSCVDDARVARGIWRAACGRVQVMCPACCRGDMTAGPDVIRGSGPDQKYVLRAHRPQSGFPDRRLDRFASRHHHPRNWNAPLALM